MTQTDIDVLITEDISGPGIDKLNHRYNVVKHSQGWKNLENFESELNCCRALLVRNQTKVTDAILAMAPRLQIIGRAGAGLDNIDLKAASNAGIVVASTPDQNSLSVAELGIGMMIALARNLIPFDKLTKEGNWDRSAYRGNEVFGKTLGVVGFGRIGYLTAARARALGMNIIAHDKFISPDSPNVVETRAELVEFQELLSRADVISCHLPSTEETHHLFCYETFKKMQNHALFLNLSRGHVVDESGLEQILSESALGGAALDVREVEPPGVSNLANYENVILTPHIAAFTDEAQKRVVDAVCRDIDLVLSKRKPLNYVNFPKPARDVNDGSYFWDCFKMT